MKHAELRRKVEEMEAELPLMESWRNEEGIDAAERAERADFVREYAYHTREARRSLDYATKMRNRRAILEEHRTHEGATWGEVSDELRGKVEGEEGAD